MSSKSTQTLVTSALPWLLLACAPRTPGANPHDMSAAQHEEMARQEHAEAEAHSAQYDPAAQQQVQRCNPPRGACWTSTTNPTKEHLEHAEVHRKRSADHRAASQSLRDAEAQACVGVSDADRDMSPFAHREEIESVEPLYSPSSGGKNPTRRLEGATVVFRAVPGMTAQWLQRVIDCHLARNAALGHDVSEMAYCPLVMKGVTASVTPTQSGFAVAIKSDDTDVAREVLRRAQSLARR